MNNSIDSLSAMGGLTGTSPAVLLTPGRTRNIAQDMEALRLSRQDNPYLQQVMASRESLIESHMEECESDDTVLMSQEFGSSALELVEEDPLTLKEVHDHMIRSPPPTSCWPHDSLSLRASSAFDFSGDGSVSYSAYSVHSHPDQELLGRSPRREFDNNNTSRTRSAARSATPRSRDSSLGRPLSLPGESHVRSVLGARAGAERLSLLAAGRCRPTSEDGASLVARAHKCMLTKGDKQKTDDAWAHGSLHLHPPASPAKPIARPDYRDHRTSGSPDY